MFKIIKIFAAALSVSLLYGCLATTNLLNDGALDGSDLSIATEMAARVNSECTRYSEKRDGSDRSGNMRVTTDVEVKSFYKSDSGWYKADILAATVWDAVYFQPDKQIFICGQKTWDQYSDARTIVFKMVNSEEKNLDSANTATTLPQKRSRSVEDKLKELKDLYDKKLLTEKQFNDQVIRVMSEKK